MKTNNLPHFYPFKNQTGDTCQMQTVAAACQAFRRRAGVADEALSTWYLLREGQRRENLPYGDTTSAGNGTVPSMEGVLAVAREQGIPPLAMQSYYGQAQQATHDAAATAKLTGSYVIPIDQYNPPATAALVRGALEQGHIVSIGMKMRRWLVNLNAPEDQHLAIAAAVVPDSYEHKHLFNHRLLIVDADDNVKGYQGLGFYFVNSIGDGWAGERGVAILGPQAFKDAIEIHAMTGFAGCNDRWTYDNEGIPGQVYRLYQAAFNRVPDKGGLGYQINAVRAGLPMWQLAINFMASPEGQQKLPPTLTNAQYVDRLYDNVLHRPGDAGGIAWHLGNLNAGMARHDVLMQFSESPENKTACAPAFERGVAYT